MTEAYLLGSSPKGTPTPQRCLFSHFLNEGRALAFKQHGQFSRPAWQRHSAGREAISFSLGSWSGGRRVHYTVSDKINALQQILTFSTLGASLE